MKAQTFELKTPYLKTGRSHNILAQTDLINVAIKYYYDPARCRDSLKT